MKSTKLKIGIAAIMIAFLGAGATSVQALEYWRPDKVTGVQINPNRCTEADPELCATIYLDNTMSAVGTIKAKFE